MPPHGICLTATALAAASLLAAAGPPQQSGPRPRENFVETVRAVTRPNAPSVRDREQQVRFEMIYVPGGEFAMGSPEGEPGREPTEGPRHRVRVGGFWME